MQIMPKPQPAIFLDRDGTLMKEVHYCRRPEDVEIFAGVAAALAEFREMGYRNVIITNQSGLGRGLLTLAEYEAVNAEVLRQIGSDLVDAVYFCPDLPESASERRKPAPGMLLEAATDLNLDLAASWMIGDKASDIAAGRNAGTRSVLVRTGYGLELIEATANLVVADICAAPAAIREFDPDSASCAPAA